MPEADAEKDKVAPEGVHALRVFSIGLGILVALAAALATMVGFFSLYAPSRQFARPETFPSPRIFERQGAERKELYAEQRRRLDQAAVPIMEAMGLVVARGSSAYSPLNQTQEKKTPAPAVSSQEKPNVAAPPAHPNVGQRTRQRHRQRPRGVR